MRPRLLLFFSIATSGCALTARGNLGFGASRSGADGRAGASFGAGFAREANEVLFVATGQPGIKSALMMFAPEYDRNLRSKERPLGLRIRIDTGVEYTYRRGDTHGGFAAVAGVMPGAWWMPLHDVYRAHRFVLAIEPRVGVRIPANDGTTLGPFGDLGIVTEWDWVPCTLFGAGSCRPHGPDGE